jgi:uncharacterized membrane protein
LDEIGLLVSLGFLCLLVLILGPIGFFIALSSRRETRAVLAVLGDVQSRLRTLEAGRQVGEASAPAPKPVEPEAPAATMQMEAPAPAAVDEPASLPDTPAAVPPAALPPTGAWTPSQPPTNPPRPGRSLEESLGTRWTVWVGGVALALGAILLVRYSVERGFFGPGVRTFFGGLFALGLVAAGEVLRRRDVQAPAATGPAQPYIPGVLTAAGTIAAFATLWAAHALYGFIGPAPAFVLLGAVGIATMAAASLHGPALAGLGLVGALVTPALVSSKDPSAWPLVLYLGVVAAAAYGLARLRGWLWLALATALGVSIWGFLLAGSAPAAFFAASMVHLLLQTALALFFVAYDPNAQTPDDQARLDRPAHLVVALFTVLAFVTLAAGLDAGRFGTVWMLGAGAVIALFCATAVRLAPVAGAAVAAALVALFALRFWPAEFTAPVLNAGEDMWKSWLQPRDPVWFSGFALLASAGTAAAAGWRLFAGPALGRPIASIYAGVAALTPLAALGLVFLRFTRGEASNTMAGVAAATALALVLAARAFQSHPRIGESEATRLGLGALAASAIAALALGLVFALQGGTLTVALALAALGAAFVAVRLDLAALRWCVCAFGILVAARLAWEPRIVGAALVGTTPILNWLLFGYGIPALAFGYAAHLMARSREDVPVRVARSCSILFSFLLVFFEIRHALNGGDAFAPNSGLVEEGLMALTSFGFSLVLMSLDAARANPVFRIASLIASGIGMAIAIIGLGVVSNPFFTNESIAGGKIFNALIIGYILPGLAAFLLAQRARKLGRLRLSSVAGVTTIGFLFTYASLEVRRFFHDERIGWLRSTSDEEWYTYSAVWLMLGILLLAFGLLRGSREARIASAAFIVLTVVKVFLFDLAGLEGILRALSFIGLGGVLIAIGLVYQKVVFVRRPA